MSKKVKLQAADLFMLFSLFGAGANPIYLKKLTSNILTFSEEKMAFLLSSSKDI